MALNGSPGQSLASAIVGIEGLTFVIPAPGDLTEAYGRLFGTSQVRPTRERVDIAVGTDAVRYLSPSRFARRYPGHPFGDAPPAPAVITFRVVDLARARDLVASDLSLAVAGERLVRLPLYGGGPLLEFAES